MSRWSRVGAGFLVFFIVIYVYGIYLVPILTGPVGGILSPLGALSAFITTLVVAFVAYWIYAFTVEKVGGEPEA